MVYVTGVSTWAKAVPCFAGSIQVSMLYLNMTFTLFTTELFTTAMRLRTTTDYSLENDGYIKQIKELGFTVIN